MRASAALATPCLVGLGASLLLATGTARAAEPTAPAAPPGHAAEAAHPPAPGAEPEVAGAHHEEHGGHEAHGHHPQRDFFFGAQLVMLGSFKGSESERHVGLGGFLEFSAIHHWLEIEFGLRMVNGKDGLEMPFDVIFKKPFHLNSWMHPYVGLGPTVLFTPGSNESAAHFGLATALGSYFWLSEHAGLSAELNYNLLSDSGALHEVGGAAGIVLGY
jgi:hypothetical protein